MMNMPLNLTPPVINPNVERIWVDQIIVANPADAQGTPLTPVE